MGYGLIRTIVMMKWSKNAHILIRRENLWKKNQTPKRLEEVTRMLPQKCPAISQYEGMFLNLRLFSLIWVIRLRIDANNTVKKTIDPR